jgi:hypothetical protein
MTHRLKTWPAFFRLVEQGVKPFEYRKNDRDYKAGDTLVLCEFSPYSKTYLGGEIEAEVLSVIDSCPGLPDGYCIMGIRVKG